MIKAAQAAGTSEANATSSNHTSSSNSTPKVNNNVPLATALGSTASSTPSKAPPPGFGQPLASVRSQSASPLTSESNLNDVDQRTTQPLKRSCLTRHKHHWFRTMILVWVIHSTC